MTRIWYETSCSFSASAMAAAGRNQPPTAADSLAGQLTLADWERELAHDALLATRNAPSEASQPQPRALPPPQERNDTSTHVS